MPKSAHVRLILAIMLLAAFSGCRENFSSGLPTPNCNINAGPCTALIDGQEISLDISPRPVRPMTEELFSLSFDPRAGIASAGVSLVMPGMYMGENRFTLSPADEGRLEGTGVFPRCPSGQNLWQADITLNMEGREQTVPFVFLIEK